MEGLRRIIRRVERTLLWLVSKNWKPHSSPEKIKRVVVLELTRLGDVVASTVLREALAKEYPEASFEWWVREGYQGLFKNLKNVSVKELPVSSLAFFFSAFSARFELKDPSLFLVSASPAIRHSLLTWYSNPARALGFLFPKPSEKGYLPAATPQDRSRDRNVEGAPLTGNEHMVARDLKTLEVGGIKTAKLRPNLGKSTKRRKGVVLHPGANWRWRRWPLAEYVELGARLVKLGQPVTMVYDQAVVDSAGDVAGDFEGRCKEHKLDLVKTGKLEDLVDVLSGARLFVGNDSGPMHLAAALGTPCIGLFGPNLPERSGPWPLPGSPGSPHVVLHQPPDCCPCDQVRCVQPEKWCMADISVDAVYKAATVRLRAGR